MQHVSDALNALHADCAWFARAHELRLLVVRTSGDMRATVTKLLPRYEFHADNRSPWVLADDPYERRAPHWESRGARLLENWERRRAVFAGEGVALPEAAPRGAAHAPGVAPRPDLDLFLSVCVAVLDALRPPLDGLVLVLAPTVVEDAEHLDADLTCLLTRPEIAGCRVVLVLDVDVPPPAFALRTLDNAALVCACVTDPAQKRRDLQVVVGLDSAAPPAGVWPSGVVPPRRVDAQPEPSAAASEAVARALGEAGISPAYLEHAPALRRLILGAALAMGEGQTAEGVRIQADAVLLSYQIGMPLLMVICQIALASYLSAAGDGPAALTELTAAEHNAAAAGLPDQQGQACLAQGLLHALARRPLDAAAAYYRCAQIAEGADSRLLAIEAWRLAGQASLEGGASEHGVHYLQRALAVAGQLDPAARSATSAPEVARRLAALYDGWGYAAHARALYDQADAIERGAPAEGALTAGEPRGRDHAPAGAALSLGG